MRTFLALPLAIVSCLASAQLTASAKSDVVDQLCKAMVDRYVMRDKADEVARLLHTNLKTGKYDSISEGAVFAKTLSDQINALCKDAHLRVRYSEKALPARKDRAEPSAEEIAEQARHTRLVNAGFEEVRRLQGNVGYIKFNGFLDTEAAKRPLQAAMEFVKETDALVFDMRENGGGDPATVALVCSYLFDKKTHINDLLFREGDKTRTEEFFTHDVSGPKYLDKPIFVLVSKRTGSGAEEFTYNLQTQKRATIIGESTWGGANPGGTVRLTDHFSAFIPVGMARNPVTMTNWEGTGVTPDVKVDPKDALKEAQVLAVKKLLETAKGADKERLASVLKELGS